MNGLIIKVPYIDNILDGYKVWEIRGSKTKIRGKIALIQSGTKKIVGTAFIVDCIPLSKTDLYSNMNKHCIQKNLLDNISYKKCYAWVLSNVKRLKTPIPYKHKKGAIIWVKLEDTIKEKIKEMI